MCPWPKRNLLLLASIRYGLGSLTRFSGRDRRSQFWPYAAFVLLLLFTVGPVVMAITLGGTSNRVEQFAAAHPDLVVIRRQAGGIIYKIKGYHPELYLDFVPIACATAGLSAAAIALLAAAVARRLHDVGVSAYWGLLPIPFLIFALIATPMLSSRFSGPQAPDIRLFLSLFLNNVLYMIAFVVLVILLARRTTTKAGPVAQASAP